MSVYAAARLRPMAIDLNHPSHVLSWSFLTITVANLIVIAVMVVIFGAALIIRFPHSASLPPAEPGEDPASAAAPEPGDEGMWTAKIRTTATRLLAPKKLLPDRQPAYVSSWIYTFGIASLVALAIVIGSGFGLAIGGPDWWHTNPVGHFFNSLHLWSVELFMAFLVIHLWGKFWMAAWRGRRAMTWITGVIAFAASVTTAFTGYLAQQNFDSQWISARWHRLAPADRAGQLAETVRHHPADQRRRDLRAPAAVLARQDHPGAGNRPDYVHERDARCGTSRGTSRCTG